MRAVEGCLSPLLNADDVNKTVFIQEKNWGNIVKVIRQTIVIEKLF